MTSPTGPIEGADHVSDRNMAMDEAFIDRMRRCVKLGRERVPEGIRTEPCTEYPLLVRPENHIAVARIRGDAC